MKKGSSTGVTDQVLAAVAPRFGIQAHELRPIGTSGSRVYEFWRDGRKHILRISSASSGSLDLLRGELDWINYLSLNGVSVCTPVASHAGHLVEVFEAEVGLFAAIVFLAAEGRAPVDFIDRWDDDFFQQWGHLQGRMHALAKVYRPPSKRIKRPEWHQMEDAAVDKYVPPSQSAVLANCHGILEQLRNLPTDEESYGLIHADLHRGNFFVNYGVLTVFDFDSCQYCWFVYDIAVSLFHAVMKPPGQMTKALFARRFLEQFMQGYHRANHIHDRWLARLPLFLRFRRIVMYIDGLRYWDLQNLTKNQGRFLVSYRRQLEKDAPVLDMPLFEKMA